MANNIFFERYTNIRDIKKQWLQLDKVADSINDEYIKYTYYQTYEWNEFLYDHLTKGLSGLTTTMCYDLVTVSGKPFGIIPLTVTRLSKKARIPSCRVAGVLNMVCPYVEDFGEDIVAAVADHIKRTYKGMKLSLADVPCCSPFAKVMSMVCDNVQERTSYHVPLSLFASHDEYVSSLPKNIYKNIRKAYNHLKTDGKSMQLRVFGRHNMPSEGYMRSLWMLYLRRKMAWRNRKINVVESLKIEIKSMFETYSGCAGASLRLLDAAELYVLEIDGTPAAFMIVYRHHNRLLMPKLAIDTTFSRYSPGILLILEASKMWIDEGIADFDMCRGDERYKKEMGGINEPLCRIDKRL